MVSKKSERQDEQIERISFALILMVCGIILFKFIPIYIWGNDILFDASFHIIFAFLVLYVLWFFVDQNPRMHFPFFLLSILILYIISIQRISVSAHNDIGLLLGMVVALSSIGYAERKKLKGVLEF